MSYLKKVLAIVWKDLISELRTKEMVSSMLVFSLMVVVIFNLVFEPGSEYTKEIIPGVLWVAFAFAGLLGLNRSFIYEVDKGCLQGLMLSPVDRSAIYLGKMLGNLIFMTIVEAITLPIFTLFYNVNLFVLPLIGIILLGTLGFTAVGTLFSAIAVRTRSREVMLPVLHFPVVVPVILSAVRATGKILEGHSWSVILPWLKLLIGFDLIFIILSVWTFEYVIEE
ncbi:MAG: heme exporter protein CcmB [candidate division KSB1 bacterium]|nr:heme exporter protein CcmB [candidate division KSB1 bacterium]